MKIQVAPKASRLLFALFSLALMHAASARSLPVMPGDVRTFFSGAQKSKVADSNATKIQGELDRHLAETKKLIADLTEISKSKSNSSAQQWTDNQSLIVSKAHEIEQLRAAISEEMNDRLNKFKNSGLPSSAEKTSEMASRIDANFKMLIGQMDQLSKVKLGKHHKQLDELKTRLDELSSNESNTPSDAQPTSSGSRIPPRRSLNDLPKAKLRPTYLSAREDGFSSRLAGLSRIKQGLAASAPMVPDMAACGAKPEDLAQTDEVIFSSEVQSLAKSLGYSPSRIYRYVYENIKFEPYYGSLKGSQATLIAKAGGATDQASLLIALLRYSGIPARYVKGQATFVDYAHRKDLQRWIGAETPVAASNMLSLLWNPAYAEGDNLVATQVWVEACVPYENYRGTGDDVTGVRWIPLDPSVKVVSGPDALVPPQVGFDYTGYLSSRSYQQMELSPLERYALQIDQAIKAVTPNSGNNTLADLSPERTIEPLAVDVLPSSLPYETHYFLSWGSSGIAEAAALPESHKLKIHLDLADSQSNALLSVVFNASKIALSRVTIYFEGSTPAAQSTIDTWRANGDPASVIPCGIPVLAKIKIDGQVVATSSVTVDYCAVGMKLVGWQESPDFSDPTGSHAQHQTFTIKAAQMVAFQQYVHQASDDWLAKRSADVLNAVRSATNLNANYEEVLGGFLNLVGLKYFRYLDDDGELIADYTGNLAVPNPGFGLTSSRAKINYVMGVPFGVQNAGFVTDATGGSFIVSRSTADMNDAGNLLGLYQASYREAYIWAENADQNAISTVRVLQFANEKGIQVLTLTSSNWAQQSPLLTSNADASANYTTLEVSILADLVNRGGRLVLPRSRIRYADWNGIAYFQEISSLPNHLSLLATFSQANGAYSFMVKTMMDSYYRTLMSSRWSASQAEYLMTEYAARFGWDDFDFEMQYGHFAGYKSPAAAPNSNDVTSVNNGAICDGTSAQTQTPGQDNSGDGSGRDLSDLTQLNGTNEVGGVDQGSPVVQPAPAPVTDANTTSQTEGTSCGTTGHVNMLTGNEYHSEIDLRVKGRGVSFDFVRSYNSRQPAKGWQATPIGFGWTHSYNQYLTFDDRTFDYGAASALNSDGITSSVIWTDGTGGDRYFKVNGASTAGVSSTSTFGTLPGFYVTIARQVDGTYTITKKDGSVLGFQSVAGKSGDIARLLYIKDVDGNQLNFTYSGANLSTVTDNVSAARVITLKYDASNRISSISDWTGRTYSYNYDAAGNLTEVYNPLSIAGLQRPVRYEYFSGGSIDHALKKITLPRGNSQSYEYYIGGRLFRETNTAGGINVFSYNALRRESSFVNKRGYQVRYLFDENGAPVEIDSEVKGVTRYTYDPANPYNRLTERNESGYLRSYKYDSAGNVTQITLPSGATIEYSNQNSFGAAGKIKDERGNYKIYKFDARGHVTDVMVLRSGVGASITDTQNYTAVPGDLISWISYTYDSYGNVQTVQRMRDFSAKTGPVLTNGYNDTVNSVVGLNKVSITRKGDRDGDLSVEEVDSAVLVYDGLGRLKTGVDSRWYDTYFEYDDLDRVTTFKDKAGKLRTLTYDPNGNVIKTALSSSTTTDVVASTYDLGDRLETTVTNGGGATTYNYDEAGSLSKVTTPDGYATNMVYDGAGRLIRKYDEIGNGWATHYDVLGRVLDTADGNGNGQTFTYYDSAQLGLLKTKKDAIGRTVSFSYDAGGNVISVTDNKGQTSMTVYDELNRPIREVGPVVTSGGNKRRLVLKSYSPLGNLNWVKVGTTDATGTNQSSDVVLWQSAYKWDDYGHLLQETVPSGQVRRFTYDLYGNMLTMSLP